MRRIMVLPALVLVAMLGTVMACATAVGPPTLHFCGVDTLRVPVTVDSVTYEEIVISPRLCEE